MTDAVVVKHRFVNGIPDDGRTDWAGPKAWNDTHAVQVTGPGVVGRSDETEGDAEVITGDALAALMAGTRGDVTVSNDGRDWEVDFAQAPVFQGDSGTGGVEGIVPAPAAGDAAAGKFLSANGGWVANSANFTQGGTGAVTRTMQDKGREVVSLLDFGGVPSGSDTDIAANNTALSNAVAYLLSNGGGTLRLPRGAPVHYDAQINIDESGISGAVFSQGHVSVIGEGSGASTLFFRSTSAGVALNLYGGTTIAGAKGLNGNRLEGFTLLGTSGAVTNQFGLWAQSGGGVTHRDLVIGQFWTGYRTSNTVGHIFDNCRFSFNNYGWYGDAVGTGDTSPTEHVFINCHWFSNANYGMWQNGGSPISFFGGSFEGSGSSGSDTNRWQARFTNLGQFGGGLNMFGTHFEGCSGVADVWLDHQSWPSIYNIHACDFARSLPSGAAFPINHIRFDTTGTNPARISVANCAFIGVNGYTPSASRRVIAEGTVSGTVHRWHLAHNLYQNKLELPIVAQGQNDNDNSAGFARSYDVYAGGVFQNTYFEQFNNVASSVGNFQAVPYVINTNNTARITADGAGNVIIGTNALLGTTVTDGFFKLPGINGAPTGTPTTHFGKVPMCYDVTGNRLYAYNGGAWVKVTLT